MCNHLTTGWLGLCIRGEDTLSGPFLRSLSRDHLPNSWEEPWNEQPERTKLNHNILRHASIVRKKPVLILSLP